MSSINITNARKKLYKIVQRVNVIHEPIEITGKDSTAVIKPWTKESLKMLEEMRLRCQDEIK